MQVVGLATDLAVFYIILMGAAGRVDLRLIPFAASSTLKARKHGGKDNRKTKQRPALWGGPLFLMSLRHF
jgi:hypothetical protein